MKLDEGRFALGVDEPEGVNAEAFHEAERAGDRAVGHDPHDHVHAFRRQRYEVPEIVVRRLRLREAAVGLLLGRVNEVGKLDGVLDEEDRDVVADDVPVALFGIELHRKAAHIARKVCRALVACNRREADKGGRFFAGALENVGARDVRQAIHRSRNSREPQNRARARPAPGCARGRSEKSFRENESPQARPVPLVPTRSVFWSSATGMPCCVVRTGLSSPATWWVSPPGPW